LDQTKEALGKAKMSLDRRSSPEHRESSGHIISARVSPARERAQTGWVVPPATLDFDHLKRHRIITQSTDAPAHMAFNRLRTRLLKALKDNNWRRVAITSPSPASGKSVVAVNLALSMARVPHCRTVLIDLDLRKPTVGHVLGVRAKASIGQYYSGTAKLDECFLSVAANLFIGLSSEPIEKSSELLQGPITTELYSEITAGINPDVIIFDLPPLLVTDDAIAFIPSVDAVLLVAAAGTTTIAELNECERQISSFGKYVGIILNKADVQADKYKYGY
jgi:capsular exopolysaccharide synthesis family protein